MVPTLTHLQFVLLNQLISADLRGKDLRVGLCNRKIRHTKQAFYQLMERIESAKWAIGDAVVAEVGDGFVHFERKYSITELGRAEIAKSIAFYAAESQ